MAADSLHEDVMRSVAATVLAAGLDGITEERIHTRLVEDRSNLVYPCVLILVDGEREALRPFSTEEDERVLPVQLHVLDRQDRKDGDWLAGWLQKRQQIANAILMQVPEDIEGVWHVEIEPTSVIDGSRLLGRAYEDARGGFTVSPQIITGRITP